MDKPTRPISESYWVEPGRLLAGEYPGQYTSESTRQRIDSLLEAGFDTFIDLTRPNETVPYFRVLLEEAKLYEVRVERHNFPIGDFGLPTPEAQCPGLQVCRYALLPFAGIGPTWLRHLFIVAVKIGLMFPIAGMIVMTGPSRYSTCFFSSR